MGQLVGKTGPGTRRLGLAGVLAAQLCLLSAGCGGGGGSDPAPAPAPPVAGPPAPAPAPGPLSTAQRTAAANATVASTTNACAAVKPFYWEIGDSSATLAAGSTDAAGSSPTYTAGSVMAIASASKWVYAAAVAQQRGGALTASDIKFLRFQSGYHSLDAFGSCNALQTVDGCLNAGSNGAYTAGDDGRFHYDGGHMQKHASVNGLGGLGVVALASHVRTQIGADVALSYVSPQLGGGVSTTPGDYGRFLRKLLGGQLQLGALLGTNAVCTNPATCAQAGYTPVPASESWHYALGHWVEDDPVVGDGAFSSAGAFGFYPWVDAAKAYYGVLARRTTVPGGGNESAACGRLLRKAWSTGTAQ